MHEYKRYVFRADIILWWNANKEIPDCLLMEGVPELGGVAYRQQVVRYTQEPYEFTYSHPTDIITGIACVPLRKDCQSPEAKVTKGGINHRNVTIRLTPTQRGKWGSHIIICARRMEQATEQKERQMLALPAV